MKKPIAFSEVMKSNWFLLIYMMQISSIIRRSEKQLLYLLFSSSVSLVSSSVLVGSGEHVGDTCDSRLLVLVENLCIDLSRR